MYCTDMTTLISDHNTF